MAAPGVSTIGATLSWGAAGETQPNTFTLLTRINSIGEIALDVEQIDASALEDDVTKYISGRADTGGSVDVVVNVTDATIAEWEAAIAASNADTTGEGLWWQYINPHLTKSYIWKGATPTLFPFPGAEQNSLQTATLPITVTRYVGLSTKVTPS